MNTKLVSCMTEIEQEESMVKSSFIALKKKNRGFNPFYSKRLNKVSNKIKSYGKYQTG